MKLIFPIFIFLIFPVVQLHAQNKLFTELSDSLGLDYIYPGNEYQIAGGGIMVIDVNNDGWEDLFQSGGVFPSKLWINQKGEFSDQTAKFGLDVIDKYFIQAAVCADYDNDGFQDFFIANYGVGLERGDKLSPVLLRNLSGEKFELIDLSAILAPGNFSNACWGDINNDGFSDLYLTNYVASMGGLIDSNGVEIGYDPRCYSNKLLLNLEGRGFRECAVEYGLDDPGCGLSASFTDVDNDGDMDLLLLNDFGEWTGQGNKLFINNSPNKTFTDGSEESGFSKFIYGMGIGQGDFDEDGDLDYYITNIGQNYLFQNTNGKFSDVAKELNVDLTFSIDSIMGTSWSGIFFDQDFDGDLDLYVTRGNILTLVPKTVIRDRNKLFLNENGQFKDVSSLSGIDDVLSHRGACIFDFDHDGDLDIVSAVVKVPWAAFAKMEQKIKLYRNESDESNWIGIRLIGSSGINRDCFGCKVLFEQDATKMMREVDGASGHASQSSRVIYYGLGDKKELKKATVYWTNGMSFSVNNLQSGYVYEIHPDGTVSVESN